MKKISLLVCLFVFSGTAIAERNIYLFNNSLKYSMTVKYQICLHENFNKQCNKPDTADIPPASSLSKQNSLTLTAIKDDTNAYNSVEILDVFEPENSVNPSLLGDCGTALHTGYFAGEKSMITFDDHGGNNTYITCS